MSIEEQIREIVKEELNKLIEDVEEKLRDYQSQELEEFKNQLSDIFARLEKLESDVNEKMNLVVKLRKYTLDQLMSEYKRLMGFLRPGREESEENAAI